MKVQQSFARNTGAFYNPKITKVEVTIEGIPNQLYSLGMRAYQMYRGVLLIWIRVGQGLTALAVGAGGSCFDIFSLVCHFSFLSPSLWETARYRLKYCLKGPLTPKQPTKKPIRCGTRQRSILRPAVSVTP